MAKSILERAGLPNEVLGKVWSLADQQQRGVLDLTDFIIAMHLITSLKSRAMTTLPVTLPPGLYEAASRRGQPSTSRNSAITNPVRSFSGPGSVPQRSSSEQVRTSYGQVPQQQVQQSTGPQWLVSPQEKVQFDNFFDDIDKSRNGTIDGQQAVKFFSNSGLSEEILATIWDLSDIRAAGQLNKDEFAVAMYLIRQHRSGTPIPAFLPPALIPPSMRSQPSKQSFSPTSSTFGGPPTSTRQVAPITTSNTTKSAADDLFGLDSLSPRPSQQIPQATGGSLSGRAGHEIDPFTTPSDQQMNAFKPPAQTTFGQSDKFKPFQPTSAFGASLTSQNTGGSNGSAPSSNRMLPFQQQSQLGNSTGDDLLGDNDEEQSRKLTEETTELANMSTQVGNLRTQMQNVQEKRGVNEKELSSSNSQKQELEQRLAQFRAQYEQEVRIVKSLEQQLVQSKESTKKLQQELAMVQIAHQDIISQHSQVSQALEADRVENTNLKTRMSQLNTEISQLKPQLEKMRSEARQQKGMVAINKKQLSTNEAERGKLNEEMFNLSQAKQTNDSDRALSESPAQINKNDSGNKNPFFRKVSSAPVASEGVLSSDNFVTAGPSPATVESVFGPVAIKPQMLNNTPPLASFGRFEQEHHFGQNLNPESSGRSTPVGPISRALSPAVMEMPPPLADKERPFTPNMLPMHVSNSRAESVSSSNRAVNPYSAVDSSMTPKKPYTYDDADLYTRDGLSSGGVNLLQRPNITTQQSTISLAGNAVPGSFPKDGSPKKQSNLNHQENVKSDFDAAFADFDKPTSEAATNDVFDAVDHGNKNINNNNSSDNVEFYPMTVREVDSDSSSDEEEQPKTKKNHFEDDFDNNAHDTTTRSNLDSSKVGELPDYQQEPDNRHAEPSPTTVNIKSLPSQLGEDIKPPPEDADVPPPPYPEESIPGLPVEFEGLLPAREDPTAFTHHHSLPLHDSTQPIPTTNFDLPSQSIDDKPLPLTNKYDESNMRLSSRSESSEVPASNKSTFLSYSTEPIISQAEHTPPHQASQISQNPKVVDDDGFDDDFADLTESKQATADDEVLNDFANTSHISETEFNPTFASPTPSHVTSTTVGGGANVNGTHFNHQTPMRDDESINKLTPKHTSESTNQSTPLHDAEPSKISTPNTTNVTNIIRTTHSNDFIPQSSTPSGGSKNKNNNNVNNTIPTTSFYANPSNTITQAHDWDAIFSGLNDINATNKSGDTRPDGPGRALSTGTEHDDPILKRLTSMGYERSQALNALEMYDYDVNKVCFQSSTDFFVKATC